VAFDKLAELVERKGSLPKREVVELVESLGHRVDNMGPNVGHAAKALAEHVETAAAKMRADVEAMAIDAARRHLEGSGELVELMTEGFQAHLPAPSSVTPELVQAPVEFEPEDSDEYGEGVWGH
jgi:hypothetical protein